MEITKSIAILSLLIYCYGLNAQSAPSHNSDISTSINLEEMDKEIALAKKRADGYGGLAIGFMIASTIMFRNLGDGESPNYNFLFMGLGSGFVACIFGTVGIIYHLKKNNLSDKRKQLLKSDRQGNIYEQSELYIGMTSHGVGLSIVF